MADKIVAEYTVKVDKALKDLDKLASRVDKVGKTSKKSAKSAESAFGNVFKNINQQFIDLGKQFAAAFAVQQIVSFGKEAVTLAAKAEGIERAFQKLNNPNLLKDLREATRGTVSDLQLMQQAVRAKNFKVPLDQLAGYFKFATNRAIETGESVDYLVNSIIDGIGRKSTLVLDNLGISATELQEEMKKTGDFGEAAGNIIARELEKAGDVADTTATKIAQLNTLLVNAQTLLGKGLIASVEGAEGAFSPLTDAVNELANAISGAENNLFDFINEENALIAVSEFVKNAIRSQLPEWLKIALQLAELRKEFIGLGDESEEVVGAIEKIGAAFYELELEKRAKEAEKIFSKEAIKNLAYYNDLIKQLQEDQKDANITRSEVRRLEDKINDAIKERLILLGKLRRVGGESFEEVDPVENIELLQQQQLTDDILADYEYRNGEIEAGIKERNAKEAELAQERKEHEADIAKEMTVMSLQAISSLIGSISQIQQNAFLAEQQELEKQLEQGLITREEFDEKTKQIKKREAQAAKDAALFQAIISTATAVVEALPNIPLSVLAGVTGAAQIAAIASQPLPQFADGGWVDGKGLIHGRSHARGGVKIEAEGNEYITKGKYAKPNADILEAINTGNWERYKMENIITPAINQVLEGGFGGMGGSATLNSAFNDKNLLKGTDRLRDSNKKGFIYLGDRLERALKTNRSRWN